MKNIGSIAVFGIGHMGGPYVKSLVELGISADRIIAIDPDEKKCEALLAKFGVRRFASLDYVPPETVIAAAIVAVPSPVHLLVFKQCAARGIRNIFTEKPTVQNLAEFEELEKLGLNVFTGFLIHFSPAVDHLCNFITGHELECSEIMSWWGKNWPGCDRWMGPDLEEELVHPLVTATRIIDHARIKIIDRWVHGSWVPHVRPELSSSGERHQDSSSGLFVFCVDDDREVDIHILSSFNMTFQERVIDVLMVEPDDVFPEFKARLEFDVAIPGQPWVDRLRIINARTNKIVVDEQWSVNKVQIQLEAFLNGLARGVFDERLVDIEWAKKIVRTLDGALQ